EAVNAIGEAIALKEAASPERSEPSLASAYNNMALALDNAERDEEAEPYMIRAMQMAEALFGRADPRYAIGVANLGNLYRQSGRHREADALLGQSLRLRRELLGDEHPYVGHGLIQVARLRLRQQRAADALELAERAADIYRKAQYKDPRRLASSHEVRALALAALGQVDEGIALFEATIDDAGRAGFDNGVEWPRVMASRAELFARHRPEHAARAIDEAVQAHRAIYGDDHPGTRR